MLNSRKIGMHEHAMNEYCSALFSRVASVLEGTNKAFGPGNGKAVDEQVRALREVLGLSDVGLLFQFLSQGLDAPKAAAIELAPLAFVAWASGSVTDKESAATIKAIHESVLLEFPKTWPVIQSWLDNRPQTDLWNLWVDYTRYRLERMTTAHKREMKRRLLGHARTVARASGGWLGIGSICREEQTVIDQIERVFD